MDEAHRRKVAAARNSVIGKRYMRATSSGARLLNALGGKQTMASDELDTRHGVQSQFGKFRIWNGERFVLIRDANPCREIGVSAAQ